MTKHGLLDRLFGNAEEINGHNRCATYLYRWTMIKAGKLFSLYLHHFVGNDWSLDFHDHPKRFISIGLKGQYWEDVPVDKKGYDDFRLTRGCYSKAWIAPWIRSFPANHIHRLRVPYKNTWTLVIVLRPVREWGFWHRGEFIHWKSYVKGDASNIADSMKDC